MKLYTRARSPARKGLISLIPALRTALATGFGTLGAGAIATSLSRYVCISIARDCTIRDVNTLHAANESQGCEQSPAGCLVFREVHLEYEI